MKVEQAWSKEEKRNTLKGYALVNINTRSLAVKRSLKLLKLYANIQMTKGFLTTFNEWKLNANNPVGLWGKVFCLQSTECLLRFVKNSPFILFYYRIVKFWYIEHEAFHFACCMQLTVTFGWPSTLLTATVSWRINFSSSLKSRHNYWKSRIFMSSGISAFVVV